MENLIVEIRAAEGGADARDLVQVQFGIYLKACNINNFLVEPFKIDEAIIIFKVSGKNVKKFFEGESGGIRWQRIPPTEKRDRVHTSTITIAVLPEPENHEIYIDPRDLKESFTTGSGPGGQHRNKNQTAVQLLHIPTGILVRAESEKSQKQNRENAMTLLKAKLLQAKKEKAAMERFKLRKEQVGSGMRGDKIRTIQVRNDVVVDHKTGKRISYKDYAKGKLDGLK